VPVAPKNLTLTSMSARWLNKMLMLTKISSLNDKAQGQVVFPILALNINRHDYEKTVSTRRLFGAKH
jgi:hypothetical protein